MKVSRRSNSVLFAGASALALSLAAPTAIAQDQDQDEDARTLSTVVVTTQKRDESIQDVPIAVSAFDPDAPDKPYRYDPLPDAEESSDSIAEFRAISKWSKTVRTKEQKAV